MSLWQVLLDVVTLLGCGALIGGLFERFRQNAIVGYLVAGALLGPNALGLVTSGDAMLAVSELGVALLLFAIGLEFSWPRLRSMGARVFGAGLLQVGFTAAAGFGIALLLGRGSPQALVVGIAIALSSTACVVRVLAARAELETPRADRAIGILLVQDVCVVPAVLLVSVMADGGSAGEVAMGVLRSAGMGLGLVAALWVVFHLLVPRFLHLGPVSSSRELPLLVAVVSGLGSGVVAHSAGVSPALGAFVAGLLLAESPFAVQVRADVSGLKTVLLTLFFTSVGMLTDPGWIADNLVLVGAGLVGVVVLKAVLVFAALRLLGTPRGVAIAAGACLAQIGEFSFVVANIARDSLLSRDAFLFLVSVAVLSMVLTPYLIAAAPLLGAALARHGVARALRPDDAPDEDPEDGEPRKLTVVIGFGPAGQAAAARVAEHGCRIVIVDQNPAAVVIAHASGFACVTGDASHADVLDHAHVAEAAHVIVTLPLTSAAIAVVRIVRSMNPEARVLVRARFHRSRYELKRAGADVVVDEEQEVGRLVADAWAEPESEPEPDATDGTDAPEDANRVPASPTSS